MEEVYIGRRFHNSKRRQEMKKIEFLEALRKNLDHLPTAEVNEIIRDQDEYIQDAVLAGRQEEEVVSSLGAPKVFAASLSAESKIYRAQNSKTLKMQMSSTVGALFAILALAPLNLLFVLGPFLIIVVMTFTGWTIAASGLFASIVGFGAFFFKMIFMPAGIWAHLSSFFFILGAVGASLISLMLMYKITEYFLKITVSYLKWNLNFIKGRA